MDAQTEKELEEWHNDFFGKIVGPQLEKVEELPKEIDLTKHMIARGD